MQIGQNANARSMRPKRHPYPRHRTARCTLRRRPVGTARQAPYEPTRHPPLVLRELLHDQRVSQVLVRRSPRALEPRLVWPPWGGHAAHQRSSAPLRAMQCAPLCAEGGGSEQDERSVLRWRWEARHADRGAVARRGAQAGDGASRTANAIGPLARHRHGVTAALSIRAVRRRPPRLCFRPM